MEASEKNRSRPCLVGSIWVLVWLAAVHDSANEGDESDICASVDCGAKYVTKGRNLILGRVCVDRDRRLLNRSLDMTWETCVSENDLHFISLWSKEWICFPHHFLLWLQSNII